MKRYKNTLHSFIHSWKFTVIFRNIAMNSHLDVTQIAQCDIVVVLHSVRSQQCLCEVTVWSQCDIISGTHSGLPLWYHNTLWDHSSTIVSFSWSPCDIISLSHSALALWYHTVWSQQSHCESEWSHSMISSWSYILTSLHCQFVITRCEIINGDVSVKSQMWQMWLHVVVLALLWCSHFEISHCDIMKAPE